MRKRIRKWIIDRAPICAKASLQAENARLEAEIVGLRAELARKDAYIQGLQYAVRAIRKITINTAGEKV